jgi:radical SAM superfamily enzyme YgiQ (UPF0313 family)
MKIGLYDIDSRIPNLALMKLSAYHKSIGNDVEFYSPLFYKMYDMIYASKVFTNSDGGYINPEIMIIGGSGYDLHSYLSQKIEHIYPDYDLYGIDYAMGFITRGCIRKCKFCIVHEKEGMIIYNAPLEEFTKNQEKVMLLDNNILSYKDHLKELQKLIDSGKRIDFNQGLDIRLINKHNAELLRKIKRWKGYRLRFALDDPYLIPIVEDKLEILNKIGITNKSCQFYVLIGYNTTKKEDMKRIEFLQSKGCAIFVMPFDKMDPYQKKLTRWINRYFYKYQTFEEYLK